MIAFVRGRLIEKQPGSAIVECNGLGYELKISGQTYEALDEETCMLLTHYAVSVDVRSGASAHQLYGFISKAERDVFRQLITVSGVSASLGMAILSALTVPQLQRAILDRDANMFKSVKGIGPKLAQRIVTELCEKIGLDLPADELSVPQGNMARQEALAALCSLGFDRVKADRTLNAVLKDSSDDLGVEELIKKSLQAL